MKRKLTIFAAGLLLAVGWSSVAQAQLMTASPVSQFMPKASFGLKNAKMMPKDYQAPVKSAQVTQKTADGIMLMQAYEQEPAPMAPGEMLKAPRRATYTETADKTLTFAEYQAFKYDWVDGDGESHNASLTDPVTDPYQMAYLVGTTYMNKNIPGIKYTEGWQVDHPYPNISYAWDIPNRFNNYATYTYNNVNIIPGSNYSYLGINSIEVYSGDEVILSWDYATNGTSMPTGMTNSGWRFSTSNNGYMYPSSSSSYIRIASSVLANKPSISIHLYGFSSASSGYYSYVYVNGTSSADGNAFSGGYYGNLWWNIPPTNVSVTPPDDNGYTVFLVKVNDNVNMDYSTDEHTQSWESLIHYFDKYFESIELLTDGVRVGASTATTDAGTMFSYTGNLNRFFFISKGKMFYMSSDRAPFYSMYEEFSPTTTQSGDEITDFFERMDGGEAYDVIHDCQSVNYMEHYFSMSGKSGSTHNTLSNLIFYIPDDRGVYQTRNYDHKPRVGLYTADLEATATPNRTQEHVYDVKINWSTSLQKILGFDEPETHDLWVVVKDPQGNVVLDSLLTTTTDTTYTYQVPQYPDSYTIDYIVRAWPTKAPLPVDHNDTSDGTFFADSDPDDVLIPGYNDFISIVRHHYESDFDIDNEYNYYRNFMTLGNQNGTNGLTTARIDRGENVLHLFRYDYDKPTNEVEAATLTFVHEGDQVNWEVVYNDQQYYPNHTGGESKYYLATMGIPVRGSFAVGSTGGGSTTTSRDVTFNPYGSSNDYIREQTVDGVTINSTSGDFGYASYIYLNGTTTVSTSEGMITKIVFNQYGSSYLVSNLSTTTGSYSAGTWTGNASSVVFTSSSRAQCSSIVVTVETTSGASGSTVSYDTTYTAVDSISFYDDYSATTGNFTVNSGNWSSPSNAMYMNSSGFAYINSSDSWSNYLQYTVPEGYSNATLAFNVYVGSVTSGGEYLFWTINGANSGYSVTPTSSNQYYTLWCQGVSTGDYIRFFGATASSTSGQVSNARSVNMAMMYVYREDITEISGEDVPIDVSGIQLVDQFRASTKDDTHPYRYGYRLQYTGQNTADWDTTKVSNVMIVPVKHSGSTLNGFYTFDQMIHDSIPELLQTNVKNGDLTMTLGGDAEIYYYTINRKPNDGNAYSNMSFMQFDNNHTFYTEGLSYLPQYAGQMRYPGDMIERLDNAEVLTGGYNTYMNYGPVVWTYGYDRFYFDADGLPSNLTADGIHNSYGAPVWKTGVGRVTVSDVKVERQVKNAQTGEENPSTSWKDANGADCSLYFLGVNALGELPTTNMKGEGGSNYYEPYLFRVWIKSNSGSLRGFTPISGSNGDYIINSTDYDPNMMVVYEEYTNSTTLDKALPEKYTNSRDIIKFGALKGIAASDLQVIVRFYYKVKHLDAVESVDENVLTFDFTDNEWQIPAGNVNNWQTDNRDYTVDDLTINLANKYYYNEAVGFLMLGQNGTLTLPAFDRKVKQIQVVGRPGASNTVRMNIFVGNDAASTEATGSTGTNTFDIAEQYQTIGTQYTLKVTNNYNAQIAQVIVIFEDEQTTSGFMMRAPKRAGETATSTLNFTAKCNGSGTADDGAAWTVTSDADESTFDNTKGIHYGTNNNAVSYIHLSTSDINGTIKQIVVNASRASKASGCKVDVTVGGNAFGDGPKTINTTDATDFTFTGSASGEIVVSVYKDASGTGALYCKSITVTYETQSGEVETAELTVAENVNVGTNTGNGVSVPVTISGSNLTQDLNITVSGTGFSVSPATVTADAANAGTSVTVTYNGTDANATGALTISSSEVTATVNLTASYDGGTTPPATDAVLVEPMDGSTVYVGTITAEGESVSTVIPISGNNLTQNLTASLTGNGFSFLTRDMNIPYADVNAGTASVTVVYNGTAANATGRLTLQSDEVTAIVNLTASYRLPVVLNDVPAGYVAEDVNQVDDISTGIIEMLYEQFHGQVVSVTYVNSLGMQSNQPFDGVNIVVTRYSDGTMTTTKVLN